MKHLAQLYRGKRCHHENHLTGLDGIETKLLLFLSFANFHENHLTGLDGIETSTTVCKINPCYHENHLTGLDGIETELIKTVAPDGSL